jgi:hypothetical protein
MQEAQFKFVNRPWSGDKASYSTEQLLRAIPKSMARYAKRVAKSKGSDQPTKADCHLAYREKGGDVNINGISAALGRIDQVKGPNAAEIASARAELQDQRTKARKALGLDKKAKSMAEEIGDIGFSMIEDLMESAAWSSVPETAPFRNPAPGPVMAPPGASLISNPGYHTAMFQPGAGVAPAGEFVYGGNLDGRDLTRSPGFPALFGAEAQLSAARAAVATQSQILSPVDPRYGEATSLAAKLPTPVGVVDNDYRPLPNWRTLGITRKAGDATPQELLRAFKGATKLDGSAVGPSDVYSTAALLCTNDLIAQEMAYIPPVEIGRMRVILATRAMKSDQDHSRKVMSGTFTIVDPEIGTDPGTKLHMDHPLLGKAPYTALIARLLYPKITSDDDQMAAVESAMMGKLQNKSVTFGYGARACALCGEMPIQNPIRANGNIIAFVISPGDNPDLCEMDPESFSSYDSMTGTVRTPAETPGGYIYRTVTILGCSKDGIVQVSPIAETIFELATGSVFMLNMSGYSFFGFGGRYCRLHGQAGNYARDGRKTVGMFVNIRSFVGTSEVDKGAVCDARNVADPDINY